MTKQEDKKYVNATSGVSNDNVFLRIKDKNGKVLLVLNYDEIDEDSIAGRAAIADRIEDVFQENNVSNGPQDHLRNDVYQLINASLNTHLRKMTAEEEVIYSGAAKAAGWMAPSAIPYIGLLNPMYSSDLNTLGTDKFYRIVISPWFFDPKFTSKPDKVADSDYELYLNSVRAAFLLHEIMHPSLRNIAPDDDHSIGNIAEDLVINEGLMKIPRIQWPYLQDGKSHFGVFPGELKTEKHPEGVPANLSYRAYYEELIHDSEFQKMASSYIPGSGEPSSGSGDEPNQNEGKNSGGESDSEQGSQSDSKDGSTPSKRTDASVETGNKPGKGKSMGPCDHVDSDIQDALDAQNVRKSTNAEINDAKIKSIGIIKSKGGPGTGAGFESWFMDKLTDSKVDWAGIFANDFSLNASEIIAGRSDRSYRRVSRRGNPFNPEVIMPGNVGYKLKVTFGIDSSGSMYGDRSVQVASELQNVIKNIDGVEMKVVSVDTESHDVNVTSDVRSMEFVGGGGTYMADFYKHLERDRDSSDITVLMSDMEIGSDDLDEIQEHLTEMSSKKNYVVIINESKPDDILAVLNSIHNTTAIYIPVTE
jgi:predicted metal-dependent peptidase